MSYYYRVVKHLGVDFVDYQPSFNNPLLFQEIIYKMSDVINEIKLEHDIHSLAIIEATGFIWGSALAFHCGIPFFLVRKQGKLPPPVIASDPYKTEYATKSDILEIPLHTIKPNVLIIDNLLATGSTLNTTFKLLKKCGYNVLGALVVKDINLPNKETLMKIYTIH
jgi:adenine phosphoribosyltransferase